MCLFLIDSAGYNQARGSMQKKSLAARAYELNIFSSLEKKNSSSFLAVYGRRRVGKTYLIHEYFSSKESYFEFTGTNNTLPKVQIKNYMKQLNKYFNCSIDSDSKKWPKTWPDALDILREMIEKKSKKNRKTYLFFDELPWIASKKSGFAEALDYFWNSYLSKRKDIVLIVCGSSANWMITKIVNSKGSFHNRLTQSPIVIKPFTLKETEEYFNFRGINLNKEQICEIYMVTGGVAYYLNQYEKGDSSAQFINKSFFGIHGSLRTEFDNLFQSLFDKYETHVAIVRLLAHHPFGLNQIEIQKKMKIKSGGTFTKTLNELEQSGFIKLSQQLNSKKKSGFYRLIDEYTLFYLNWVHPLGISFKDILYWQKQVGKPKYNTWLGTAFESICIKHSEEIKKSLGISGLTTNIFTFRNNKAQIDLIIDRSDKTINLCEIKYTVNSYKMTETEASKLKNRKLELLNNLKKKKQIIVTLIALAPANRNNHYLSTIDNELNLENLF